jgi:hypothetical protein
MVAAKDRPSSNACLTHRPAQEITRHRRQHRPHGLYIASVVPVRRKSVCYGLQESSVRYDSAVWVDSAWCVLYCTCSVGG